MFYNRYSFNKPQGIVSLQRGVLWVFPIMLKTPMPTMDLRKTVDKRKWPFTITKRPLLIQTGGGGWKGTISLTRRWNLGETLSSIGGLACLGRWRNGKATSVATLLSIGRKCGILGGLEKRLPLCGLFGRSGCTHGRFMNGGLGFTPSPFPNNVCYASLTPTNWLRMSFGTASKRGELGGGPLHHAWPLWKFHQQLW